MYKITISHDATYPVYIDYIGPGKRHTGDWCFADGFITFEDINEAYTECFRSKFLGIFSDCSYSGRWVRELAYFLDDVGVQPCGHSARKENILLAVSASCKSHQIPHTLLYSARGRSNDEDYTGQLYCKHCGYEVAQGQNTSWINNTRITCKKGASFADPCLIANDFTWDKERENERIALLRAEYQGRKRWWYIFLHDDEELEEQYEKKCKSGTFVLSDLTNYGCVFKSGLGQDPPQELQKVIERRFDVTKPFY